MDKDLKEAMEMIDILAARLYLAWHERSTLTTKTVNKTVKDAGKLLAKHHFPSDMAAGSDR